MWKGKNSHRGLAFSLKKLSSKICFEISGSAWDLFIKSQVFLSFAPLTPQQLQKRRPGFPPCDCRGRGAECHAAVLVRAASGSPSHLHTAQPCPHPDCDTSFVYSLNENQIRNKPFLGGLFWSSVSELLRFFPTLRWCWGLVRWACWRASDRGSRNFPNPACYGT